MIISDVQFHAALARPGSLATLAQILAATSATPPVLDGIVPKFPPLPSVRERRAEMQARRQQPAPGIAPLYLLAADLFPDLD